MIEYLEYALLLSVPLWPLLLVIALALPPMRNVTLRLIPTAPVPALITALWLSSDPELSLPWLLLGSSISIDDMSRVYLLFSSLLWLSGSLSLPAAGRLRFGCWFLTTMAGNFMVLLAQDMPTFFLAYAVMSLASFGMISHWQTKTATHAAKVYLVFAMLGEMILLSALLLMADNTLTLDLDFVRDRVPEHLLMALLFTGFGIKAGVPLLHMALPPAYAAVPLAAAVPMAGALFHLGLYGWLRFLPLGEVEVPVWSTIFVTAAVVAMLYGVCVGLTQREAKPLLAYSSISQMGIMMLGIGAGLAAPDHWPAIETALLFYALHHALAKGALFHGLGVQHRHRAGIWLPALALAGMPFSSGALAKASLKQEIYALPDFWSALIPWLLPIGSMGTTLLMARFLYLGFKKPAYPEQTSSPMWWILLTILILLPWLVPLSIVWKHALWSLTWPILLATALAWPVYRVKTGAVFRRIPSLPPGDILLAVERLVSPLMVSHAGHAEHKKEAEALLHPPATPALIALPERFLGKWQVAVILLLVLLVSVFLLLHVEF
ncbi:MAG: NADH-ubiquinone oxidoreductase [Gammaproteobacteria bacterium]|nr:NADH-ubiquinone oxidoreductase [Gammaproteobacteria bacterium]